MDIYKENILEHYKNPRNYGMLAKKTLSTKDSNPLCGDVIEMHLLFEKDKLKDISFICEGCAISKASASMLTEMVKGQTIKKIGSVSKDDVLKMLGAEISASRLQCALLPLKVLKLAVYTYEDTSSKRPARRRTGSEKAGEKSRKGKGRPSNNLR